ncbi:MAG: aminotransferase class I/II-fold pyridoxal phosphate-dependent enzyme [Clostridia bacterium]|nr:aminotransferase class I/II-fold pyridoxal phosphate-dependent enzyme [Clostridia bacterium]
MNIDSLISQRAQQIQPSPIRKFFDLANATAGTVSLGIGEPDFVTPWHIRDAAMASLRAGETAYTPNAGTMELREAVAEYLYARFGLSYDPKTEIFITVGASEALDLATRVLLNPGDEMLVPDPSYVSYAPGAVLAGGRSVSLPTYAEDGFALRGDVLKAAITDKSKALILPYPNNPTGGIMTRPQLEELAKVLEGTNLPVISDEIYGELTYSGDHASFAQIPGMKERTILISGFSKAFAMTGWRLGFAAGDRRFIAPMLKIHQYVIMCASTMSQAAATEALRGYISGDFDDVQKMRKAYDERRRYIYQRLNNMGLSCFEPRGAFYIFPCIRSTGLSSEAFAESLLKEEKVAVVPGNAFGPSGEGFVRCSYAASMKNITEAMDRMERFVKRHR